MWFHLGFKDFVAKKTRNENFCEIFLSDCVNIWHKSLSDNELLSISKTLNPLLEVSISKLKEITLNLLEDERAQKEVKVESSNITLKIVSNILGLKFRFVLLLNEGDKEMFHKEFTVPVLIILFNMQNREQKLMKIIEDKDVEIAEYKQESGSNKTYLMATKPFSKEEFDIQYPAMKYNGNLTCFFECICKLLPKEKVCEDEQPEIKKKEDKYLELKKHEKNLSVFTDKKSNQKIDCKPCVSLNNQILKKKKKFTEKTKLKL